MLVSSKAEVLKIPYPLWPHWSKMASMVGFVSCSKTVYFKFEGCDVALQWIRAHVPLSCQKRNKAIFYESCQIVFNNKQRDLNKEMLRPICTLIRIFLRFRNVQKFCHRLMIMIEIHRNQSYLKSSQRVFLTSKDLQSTNKKRNSKVSKQC